MYSAAVLRSVCRFVRSSRARRTTYVTQRSVFRTVQRSLATLAEKQPSELSASVCHRQPIHLTDGFQTLV